ncbi:MAG TPA: hypothetical protein VKZ61_03955 [Thermomicrobiales bacterium]|nr:hypothetical protein [Thermomicrobiales bacterium]
MEWKIPESEEGLEEILERADKKGPQQIRHLGKLYVISAARDEDQPRNRLVEILLNGPDWDDVDIERIAGKMRDVDL